MMKHVKHADMVDGVGEQNGLSVIDAKELEAAGGDARPTSIPTRRRRTSSYVDDGDENQVRGNWSGKLDFIFSCLSYAVGLGNVWRFPYQCYKNGGGAFVLPFMMMLVITGVPLFFLESAFGQYASSGVISIWKASPIFTGIGYAMFLVSFFVCIYYNVIIAWSFYYLIASLTTDLPWAHCNNAWNTDACRVETEMNPSKCGTQNGTWFNHTCFTRNDTNYEDVVEAVANSNLSSNASSTIATRSPSDEYFHRQVLQLSEGLHDLGTPRWELVLCLALSWVLVCLCMIKGIKSSGRAVYVTATFPYLVLLILLVRGLSLPGSLDGIIYYITPRFEKLLEPTVWGDAAVQIFFSLAPGWGGLITLSSYNKFKNNCLRDTFIVCIGDVITSLFAGLVIFAIIGYMAFELDTTPDKVATEGAGLAFVVYPEVVTRLPVAPFWAVLFFLMLITLGLGTQFAIVNTVHTTIIDMFPGYFHIGWRPSKLMIAICSVGFLCGLICTTNGGMYMLQLMDSYAATYSVLCIALTEVIALSWVYGFDQLQADIKLMLGRSIGLYWKISWKFISPIALLIITVFSCIKFKRTSYGGYVFPAWADGLGWMLTLTPILSILIVAVIKTVRHEGGGSLRQRVVDLSKPTADWGPTTFRSPPTSPKRPIYKGGEEQERGRSRERGDVAAAAAGPEAFKLLSTEATIENHCGDSNNVQGHV